MFGNQLLHLKQDLMQIHLAYAKSWRHFFPAQWHKILLNLRSPSRIPSYSIGWVINTQNGIHLTIQKVWIHQVPFGLTQAPAYFQELMTGVLKDFPFAITYLDDIIIFGRTAEENLDHIKQVFKKLWDAQLSMTLSKCHFFAKEIQYLGHILSTTGIRPLPSKTQAINNMHPSKTA